MAFSPITQYIPANAHRWARLEARPRTNDFVRSLSAEMRDPLWMLTRQWQWGEFKGEDTGSAVFSELSVQNSPITRFSKGGGPNLLTDNNENIFTSGGDVPGLVGKSVPMEASVEELNVPLDYQTAVKLGQRWKKLLASNNLTYDSAPGQNLYVDIYLSNADLQFEEFKGAGKTDFQKAVFESNKHLNQTYEATRRRTLDGRNLLEYLKGNLTLSTPIDNSSLSTNDQAKITDAENKFVAWVASLFFSPDSNAWNENQMEYQFACSVSDKPAGVGSEPEVLTADQYYHGHLDWYSFDLHKNPASPEIDSTLFSDITSNEAALTTTRKVEMLPTGVRFEGMPADRWWELEDGQINIGKLDTGDIDVASILLAEFGLVYGNEWSVVPFKLPVGSLSKVKSIVVTDTFGGKTLVQTAGASTGTNWQNWSMFTLSSNDGSGDDRLFIPPVVHGLQESEPIEKINFIRDESANMVWGVETIVPDGLGGGMNGHESMRAYRQQLNPSGNTKDFENLEGTFAQYTLATQVPENWIPFVPKKVSNLPSERHIYLRRGRMPRFIPGVTLDQLQTEDFVLPRTHLLTEQGLGALEPMDINEEEVPREGAMVKTTFQRARWYNGKTYLWMGRRKTAGRGEGNSGLRFDQLE
ncbi:MAG: hypothetical protein ACJASQ_002981 [Crocinitomicaceae bacterium]|jgi:hypothetical protein